MQGLAPRKLTIAIVNDAVTDCIAGSFISTLRFSELLSEQGHKVLFIAARSPKHPTNDSHKGIRAYRFRSILLPKSEGQLYLGFPTVRELKKIFKEEHVDIVHVMIPTFSSIASVKAAKALHIPIVTHSHAQPENLFLHLPSFLPVASINRLFYFFLNWLYGQADAIVYPSAFSQERMMKLKIGKEAVISNGVNRNIFRPKNADAFMTKFNLDPKKKNILYLGRLHPEKSVDTLIGAVPFILEKAPETHFIIAGFGHLSPKLEKLAAKLGVSSHITFTGKLADDELVSAYNASCMYVLPSLAELEGMTVLEAMACGKPILIADAPESAARHFVNKNGFLFEPNDAEDLAEKALRLLSDPMLLESSSAQSLKLSENYDVTQSVLQLENLYYSLFSRT